MTLHGIFFIVALLAKPVIVLVSLAYVFTFIALAISGTSVKFEVVSLVSIIMTTDILHTILLWMTIS